MAIFAIVLWVVGGLCELAGLALVVIEIQSDRRLAERYLAELEHEPSPGFGSPPIRPIMQMVNELEMTQGSPEEQVKKARQKFDAELRKTNEAATRLTYQQRRRFQGFVRDLLQGGLGQRKLGAALLAAGIVCGVAGNVASSAT